MSDPLYGSVVALLNFVDNEVTDRSVLSGTFTPNNGAGLVAGPPTVMRLDGVNDYVSGPSGAPYAFPVTGENLPALVHHGVIPI